MNKILPKLFLNKGKLVVLSIVFIFLILLSGSFITVDVHAQTITQPDSTGLVEGQFYPDAETTFVGKTASRSAQFLDWTLQNYNWLCVTRLSPGQCDNANDPLIPFWVIIRNIVYALIALFVLVTAFILIVTRGQNVTIMRFIPRFIFVIVLITLSFSLVQFIYQVADVVQGFFLKNVDGSYISTKDLLYMGFNYQDFKGYRVYGPQFDESAFITLLLVRLTALTYYVMTGILIIRKIILWFFIIVSPVFPLLIFYRPIRNTAKIWVGEFFRWVLYGPLFAIFLHGLVVVWKSGIPLPFDKSQIGSVVYPTAVNILLGGPGQTIYYNSPTNSNSVNLSDTFALYVVALLMLWVVIILPFILLKIFLDYIATLSIENNTALKTVVNKTSSFLNPKGPTPPPAPTPPGLISPAGIARSLPFMRGRAVTPATVNVNANVNANVQANVRESDNVLKLANLSIPKMRDIAKYETSMLSNNATVRNQATQMHNNLQKIANPTIATVPGEREKFTTVREQLLTQKQKGNQVAGNILNASQITTNTQTATSTTANTLEKRQTQIKQVSATLKELANPAAGKDVKEKLLAEKQKGNQLAAEVLDASDKLANAPEDQKTKIENETLDKLLAEEKQGNKVAKDLLPQETIAAPATNLPSVNHVQQVSLDDYEEVRKLWTENYSTIEPPKGLNGEQEDRKTWIKNDIDKINQAIALLSDPVPAKVNEGMNMVANILPFLLIGGFSKSEVVAYLKAKMEAGKGVLTDIDKKQTEEDTMVSSRETHGEGHASEAAHLERPLEENPAFGNENPVEKNKPE